MKCDFRSLFQKEVRNIIEAPLITLKTASETDGLISISNDQCLSGKHDSSLCVINTNTAEYDCQEP